MNAEMENIKLPKPDLNGEISIEESLLHRKSVRSFLNELLNLSQVSQVLWASDGLKRDNKRTAPSAGATYPLFIYLVCGLIENLSQGIYKYDIFEHSLNLKKGGDVRSELSAASLSQSSLNKAPAIIAVSADFQKTTGQYGERGIRYVYQETGHVAQNVALQAAAIGLGTVMVGAYDDNAVKIALNMPDQEQVLYLIPLGKPDGNKI